MFPLLWRSFSGWCSPICLFLLLLPVHLVSNTKSYCQAQCQGDFSISFHLKVLWFQVLHISFNPFQDIFFVYSEDKSPVSFFCRWISSFPSTIWWGNYPFPIVYSWHPCQRLVDGACVGLFLDSILFHWSMCLFLPQCYTVLITIALWYSLKPGSVVPSALLFFLKIALVFGVFSGFIWILGFFFYFCEKCHWSFGRDGILYVIHFVQCGHFNNISSSNPWTWGIFPFIVYFSISFITVLQFSMYSLPPSWLNLFLSTLFFLMLL